MIKGKKRLKANVTHSGPDTITLGEYLNRVKNEDKDLATEEWKDWVANRTEQ